MWILWADTQTNQYCEIQQRCGQGQAKHDLSIWVLLSFYYNCVCVKCMRTGMCLCIVCLGTHTQAGGLHSRCRVDSISKQTVSWHLVAHYSRHAWTYSARSSQKFNTFRTGQEEYHTVYCDIQCYYESFTSKKEFKWNLNKKTKGPILQAAQSVITSFNFQRPHCVSNAPICAPMSVLVLKWGVGESIVDALVSWGRKKRLCHWPTTTWGLIYKCS